MKKTLLRLVALTVLVAVTLTGCISIDLDSLGAWAQLQLAVSFEEMEYVRPELSAFESALDEAMEAATDQLATAKQIMEKVYQVYQLYYDFITNYHLANIYHSKDMTDVYWATEYSLCMERSNQLSAGIDRLLYALADSPVREELEADEFFGAGFFDSYEGQSLWDETFTQLMNEETALINTYYELSSKALEVPAYSEELFSGVGAQMEEVFSQLVCKRQEIARYAGYDSYPDFAYSFYYQRDFTPEQAQVLTEGIREELVPLYRRLDPSFWQIGSCTESEMLDYVRQSAEALGGTAKDAFALMDKANLYDISPSDKKYNASFEVFLLNYLQPYVFVNPSGNQRDKLTFAHEFGHFCNDYAAGGTVAGVDTAEIFSQGMEYLSLCYGNSTTALTQMKMADSLSVFVEQAAYATFEQKVYALDNPSPKHIRLAYVHANLAFGINMTGRDNRDYILIPHLFIAPMYVISYVVSNDAAMQIYQRELESAGAGLTLWDDGLYSTAPGFVAFLEEAGLESPFAPGRAAKLRQTLESILYPGGTDE